MKNHPQEQQGPDRAVGLGVLGLFLLHVHGKSVPNQLRIQILCLVKKSKSAKVKRFRGRHCVLFSQSLSHPEHGGLVEKLHVA